MRDGSPLGLEARLSVWRQEPPQASEVDFAMTHNVVQMRDFKRKEEREAADVRLAKQVMGLDTAPSEMPPAVWPSFTEKDPA